MDGAWPDLRERRRGSAVHDRAEEAYAEAAKSLARTVESLADAALAWSLAAETAADDDAREALGAASARCADRRADAEELFRASCLDGAGRPCAIPGAWRDEIAAAAEAAASQCNRDAAQLHARGVAPGNSPARAVFAEVSAGECWLEFASNVAAAERAAVGTPLEARRADEGAAERAAAARRAAARGWAEASAAWVDVYRRAGSAGDVGTVVPAFIQERTAKENAERLRSA